MPFPRFNSGSVGRLDFSTMNELFSRVESLSSGQKTGNFRNALQEPFPVKLGAATAVGTRTEFEWREQRYNATSNAFEDLPSGRMHSSGLTGSPKVWTSDISIATGEVVWCITAYAGTGEAHLQIVSRSSTSIVVARITGATEFTQSGQPSGIFKYQWIEVRPTLTGGILSMQSFTGSRTGFALNGTEWVGDAGGVYGVGMIPQAGPTLTRQRIRNDVVVQLSPSGNPEYWFFSLPIGYRVVC